MNTVPNEERSLETSKEAPATPGEFEASITFFPDYDRHYSEVNDIAEKIRSALTPATLHGGHLSYEPIVRAFVRPFVHKLCRKIRRFIDCTYDPEYKDNLMALGCEMKSFFASLAEDEILFSDIGSIYPHDWRGQSDKTPQYVRHYAYAREAEAPSRRYILSLEGSYLGEGPGFVFCLLEEKFNMPLLAIVRGDGCYYGIFQAVPNIVKKASRFLGKMGIYAPSHGDQFIDIPVPGSGAARLAYYKESDH